MARIENEACVQVFFIRKGKLIGQDYFIMNETEDENDEEILSGFIKQFYSKSRRGWVKTDKKPIKNLELIQQIDRAIEGRRVIFSFLCECAWHSLAGREERAFFSGVLD